LFKFWKSHVSAVYAEVRKQKNSYKFEQ